MKLNPVLKKEMRMFERSVKIYWIILLYNLILAAVALIIFYYMLNNRKFTGSIEYSHIIQIYCIMAYIQFGMLMLIIPGITASSISGERERQTLDILLSTKLTPYQIVFGKLQSSLTIVLLLSVTSLPIVSLVFVFGGIKLIDLAVLIILLTIEGLFVGSLGIFFSALFKKTTSATILTYTSLVVVLAGSFAAVKVFQSIIDNSASGADPSDIGNAAYILLLNPAFTFLGLISEQTGSSKAIVRILNGFGTYDNKLIAQNWIAISLTIQLAATAILTCLAANRIDPLNNRKLFKKRERNI